MPREIETFLACPVCKLVQFRVDRADNGNGVFSHEVVALLQFTDHRVCETDGVPLERSDGVQSPDAVMPSGDQPASVADVLAAIGKLDAKNIVILSELADGTRVHLEAGKVDASARAEMVAAAGAAPEKVGG